MKLMKYIKFQEFLLSLHTKKIAKDMENIGNLFIVFYFN